MKNTIKVNQMLSLAVTALTIITVVQAQEVKKENVPHAVISSFEKSYPKAIVKSYSKEERDGKTCYEVESIDGKTKRDIVYHDNGGVLEIEESIEINQLPKVVHQSVEKKYREGKILSAEKVTHGNVVTYELIVQSGEKKIEIEIDPSGIILVPQQ